MINADNVAVTRGAAEAGLDLLDAGGDCVIAFEGASLGAESFVSFDQNAGRLMASTGARARC